MVLKDGFKVPDSPKRILTLGLKPTYSVGVPVVVVSFTGKGPRDGEIFHKPIE